MTNVQDLIAATPAGGTLDLGAGSYTAGSPIPTWDKPAIRAEKPLTIVGDGAEIHVTRSSAYGRKTLRVRGPNVHLLGDVTLVHDDYLTGDRPDLEGQSGINFEGASDFVCTWSVHAAAGTNYYFARDAAGEPCRRGWLDSIRSTRAGRQHLAFQAIEGLGMTSYLLDSIVAGNQHSAMTFEPNGAADRCKNVHARNGILRGPRAWSFSSGSQYAHAPADNLDDVLFDTLTSPDLPLSCIIDGRISRKRAVVLRGWRGGGEMHQAAMRMTGVDQLEITGYHQPYRGIRPDQLFQVVDCPGAILTLA